MPQVSLSTFVAAALKGDRLLSFPTDTVPALAIRPESADLIYQAKQRSQTKPLILMGADMADLWPYVAGEEAERQVWQRVMSQYFPGALTLVLPASDRLPHAMNPTDPTTIGIRVPNSAIARYILGQTGPLATTSVNQSGQPALQTMAEIAAQFPDVLTLLPSELKLIHPSFDPHQPSSPTGMPSTVARWTGQGWEILRQGQVQLT
jgi:L-threonylcarbamoyladenylate synthase